MLSIIKTWLPLPESLGCAVFIILVALSPLLLQFGKQPNSKKVQIFSGSCADNRAERSKISIDIPQPDGSAMCLSGLANEPGKWQWSRDQSVIAFSQRMGNLSEDIYVINAAGSHLTMAYSRKLGSVMAGWSLGPDGQYLKLFDGSPSYGIGSRVFNIEKQETVCSSHSRPGASQIESNCGLIKLKDGRWWDTASGDVREASYRDDT